MSKKKNDLGVWASLFSILASLFTIYQAVKTCPCDGTPLSFKVRCQNCGHDHWF